MTTETTAGRKPLPPLPRKPTASAEAAPVASPDATTAQAEASQPSFSAPLSDADRAELEELRLFKLQRETEERQRRENAASNAGAFDDEGADEEDLRHGRRNLHRSTAQEQHSDHIVHPVEDKFSSDFQPRNLHAPPARPGYRQRWIRTRLIGADDPGNVSRKYREGWKPRDLSTIPEEFHPPKSSSGQSPGALVSEGLVLMECPIDRVRARNAHFQRKTLQATDAIDQDLDRTQRSGPVPIHRTRRSEEARGRGASQIGRRPLVMPDHGLRD